MKLRNLALAAAGTVFLALTSFAQITTVEGDVKGLDGKPVDKADIKITRTDIKGEYKTKTNKKGHYIYMGLPMGTYAVVLSMERMGTHYAVSELAITCGDGLRALPNGVRMRWTQINVNAVGGEGGGSLIVDPRARQAVLIDVSNI